MDLGKHYEKNNLRYKDLTEGDLKVALKKCKEHIKLKLKQKTLFGAHTEKNLGADPVEYYLSLASEKLLTGTWEWKDEYSLTEQMIRIVNSWISTEVEKSKTGKATSFKIDYRDLELEFYDIGIEDYDTSENEKEHAEKINLIKSAIFGDETLEFFWEAIKEGKKRGELAELLEVKPKQLDKIKERFIRTVKNHKSSGDYHGKK